WTLFGFSLTFSEYGGPFIGDCSYCGATNLGLHCIPPTTMNSISFFIYQGMFATITSALMFGSSAERVRIMPAMIFMFVWTTVVYDPIAYWTWAKNGWLNKLGSLDYAGGTPVHIASGFAGLAKALVLGKRLDYDRNTEWKPHSLSNVFLGTAILWFGWFGFNGGRRRMLKHFLTKWRLQAYIIIPVIVDSIAHCNLITCIAASTGGLTWVLFDYRNARKLSALGFCSGAVAALVAITPGSGFVAPWSAIVVGFVAGIACNMGEQGKETKIKQH
uniref:Ammonium transporter AmtB-like domain-containing protein n=1 Tax=Romanomermis culicivorax TaxID=13658 RepID=A0A915JUB5_ROMCU